MPGFSAIVWGLDLADEAVRFQRLDSIPFESEHRFMATLHHDHYGDHLIYVKGAPEQVLAMCADEQRLDGLQPLRPDDWREQIEALAPLGLFLWAVDQGLALETARTMAVNALVMGEIFYLFNSRYLHQSSLSREGVLGSRPVLATIGILLMLQLAFTYWPPLQQLMVSRECP